MMIKNKNHCSIKKKTNLLSLKNKGREKTKLNNNGISWQFLQSSRLKMEVILLPIFFLLQNVIKLQNY